MERLTVVIAFVFPLLCVFFVILPFFMIILTQVPLDTEVNPELFSGVLTSSSILFGLWSILLGNKRDIERDSHYGRAYKLVFDKGLFLLGLNICSIVTSVFSLLLFVAYNFPAIYTLCILIGSFNWTVVSFLLHLLSVRRIDRLKTK